MKKILLILLIFVSTFSYSQNTEIANGKILVDSNYTDIIQHGFYAGSTIRLDTVQIRLQMGGALYSVNYNEDTISVQITASGIVAVSIYKQDTNKVEITSDTIIFNTFGGFRITELTGALTDMTPTDSEIDAVIGLTPAQAGTGYQVTIKDSNGDGNLYKIESDGTDWFYIQMNKAVNP